MHARDPSCGTELLFSDEEPKVVLSDHPRKYESGYEERGFSDRPRKYESGTENVDLVIAIGNTNRGTKIGVHG